MRPARRTTAAALAAGALILAPALVRACAVCGAGAQERSNAAFLISTIFLSLLPLAAVGGGLLWLRRHARAALVGEFQDRDIAGGAVRGHDLPPAPVKPGPTAAV